MNMQPANFGKKIKDTRKSLGLTQKELCDRVCTQGYLSRLEKGEYAPTLPVYFGLCKKLGVDPESFYKSSEMMEQDDYVKEVIFEIRKAASKRDYHFILKNVNIELSNPAFQGNKERQFLLWHLGVGKYYLQKDFEGAINTLDEALTLSNRRSGIIFDYYLEVLLSKAIIYSDEKKYTDALMIYTEVERSINSHMEVDDSKFIVRFYYNYARLTNMLKDFTHTISLVNKGIELCLDNEFIYLLGDLHYLKGINFYDMDSYEDAHISFQNAFYSYSLINHEVLVERSLNALKETQEK